MQPSQWGRRKEIFKQDLSSDDDNSESGISTLLDEENHRVTAARLRMSSNHYLKRGRYEQDLTNKEKDLNA